MENYYETLEVSKNASKEVIEKAYKALALKYHPDVQSNNKDKKISEDKFKTIAEAYEILSDEQKKKQYDEKFELHQKKESERLIKVQTKAHAQNAPIEKVKAPVVTDSPISEENMQKILNNAYNSAYNDVLRTFRV